jgi:exopolyphosphatase/guanosine-5'-triphosphate,3'-diphosphate pyrophosphatase
VIVGAVDCGTNSTRLLVAEVDGDGRLVTLDRRTTVTRLGGAVDRTRQLSEEGVERTVAVLADYAAALRDAGAVRVRAVATSAARDARNRDAFFGPAADALGVPLELLSGEEEGALAFAGATQGLDPEGEPFLVFDVGGGSTEFVVGTDRPDGVVSVDTGSVRLTEQWLHSDPPTAEELSMAVSVVRAHLEDVTRELPSARTARTVVGVAGTVTQIAALELGRYDPALVHHFRLTRAAAEDVFRTVATEPLARRRHNPGLHPDRADVIVGGCCVVVAVMRHLDLDEVLVSETDILDGIAASIASGGDGPSGPRG